MKHFRRCAASNSYFRQKLDFKNFYGFHNWRPNGGLLIEKHVDGCWSWFSFKFWHLIMQTFCFLPCTMRFYWDWNCKLKECNEASKKSRSQPSHCEHQKPMSSISATSSRYNSATWKLQCNFSVAEHFSFTLTRYFLWRMSQKIKRAKKYPNYFSRAIFGETTKMNMKNFTRSICISATVYWSGSCIQFEILCGTIWREMEMKQSEKRANKI